MALIVAAAEAGAQTPTPRLPVAEQVFDFTAGRRFDAKVPLPAEVLGYEIGETYAQWGDVLRVLARYEGHDRLRRFEMGVTAEGRTMPLLVISAPRNLRRLDDIQAANRRLADGRAPLAEAELDRLVAKQPIIVWLAYNIHGDEAAGTEAALQVLHTLLAAQDDTVKRWLDDVVVVMNPCQNPDGRERFVVWSKAHARGRPETFAFEKENPWNVQGRYNHNYFDLNRDLIALSQPETRNAAAAYLSWLPQVSADHHGETKEYFFPPAMAPINPNLPLDAVTRWQDVFGRANAAAFDAQGWMYYVRDFFDVFYPGYWDSWPSLLGATGMTYETSGGGKAGLALRRDDGTIMTLRQAIAKHYVASLATIRAAAENRSERLRDFHRHFVSAVEAGRTGELRQVFFPPVASERGRRERVLNSLIRSGVEVRVTEQPVTLSGGTGTLGDAMETVELPAGTAVVDLAQPQGRMARALLEPDTVIDAEFVARQEAKALRNEERGSEVPEDFYEFYDITAWNLPALFDLTTYRTGESVAVSGRLAQLSELAVQSPAADNYAGAAADTVAWVLPSGSEAALRGAMTLLNAGYRLSVATRPLVTNAGEFPRGAIILRRERNPSEVAATDFWANHSGGAKVTPVPVTTAYADRGNTGIGAESVYALEPPKVLLATGEPTTPSSYGAVEFLLRETFALDYVPVAADRLGGIDLRKFNVIILPSGRAAAWAETLGESAREKLRGWVEAGGTLICLGGSTEFAVGEDTGWTSARRVQAEKTENGSSDTGAEPLPVPGALWRARLETEHFLTFGYERTEMAYLVNGDTFLRASDTGTNVVTLAEGDARIAGFTWPENTEKLIGGTAAVVDEPIGDGHIVLFADEPGYRALWWGSVRMLGNAILHAPGLRNDVGGYER